MNQDFQLNLLYGIIEPLQDPSRAQASLRFCRRGVWFRNISIAPRNTHFFHACRLG